MNQTPDYDRCETPEVLVTDRTLSASQKRARLEAWEEDLKAWLRASDESTTSLELGPSGSLLQRVVSCLEQLRSVEKPDWRTHGVSPTRNSPIPVRSASNVHWIVNSLRRGT